MKKTILVILISALSFNLHSASIQEQRAAWARDHFSKQGQPVPDGGVIVKPEKEMTTYSETRYEREKAKDDIKRFGYIRTPNPTTLKLMNAKVEAEKDFKKNAHNFKHESTHLRRSIEELKMAYTFVGVPTDVVAENIGFSPYLTYRKKQGWVGAAQFFKSKEAGVCVFSENNTKLSHGSVIIAKEDVTDGVQGKITTVEVSGTPQDGFTYTVEWFTDSFFRTLECANQDFSPELKEKVVSLANEIEEFQ